MFQWILDNGSDLIAAATAIVTAFSAVAAITPTDWDNKAAAWLRKIVDLLALNVGNAKPKPPADPSA